MLMALLFIKVAQINCGESSTMLTSFQLCLDFGSHLITRVSLSGLLAQFQGVQHL